MPAGWRRRTSQLVRMSHLNPHIHNAHFRIHFSFVPHHILVGTQKVRSPKMPLKRLFNSREIRMKCNCKTDGFSLRWNENTGGSSDRRQTSNFCSFSNIIQNDGLHLSVNTPVAVYTGMCLFLLGFYNRFSVEFRKSPPSSYLKSHSQQRSRRDICAGVPRYRRMFQMKWAAGMLEPPTLFSYQISFALFTSPPRERLGLPFARSPPKSKLWSLPSGL